MAGEGSSAVDLDAMIGAFVQDETRESLELPRTLTAEQRKQAKKIAEQLGGLKCESYGYGEERQLHLFKVQSKDRVRVKNTFIDGWEGAEGEQPAAMFRSMPSAMPIDLLQRTLERCKVNGEGAEEDAPNQKPEPASPPAAADLPDLPPMPEGFQVRNTFIHIESVPEVERIVQSMPDGMFRQCLEAELSAQNPSVGSTAQATPGPAAAAPPASTPAAPASPAVELAPGTEVVIQGLVKLPDFNGLTGVVQSLDQESGRYDVLLDGPAGQCGWRWVKVKGENCRLRMPPPPCNAPTLSLDLEDEGSGPGAVPPTPHWEEDFIAQAGLDQRANA